jgi:hypothetical protein
MSSNPNMDPVQAMLAQTSLQNTLFDSSSRYFRNPARTMDIGPGRTVAYLQRRFLPPSSSFETIQQYTVTEGVRLDNIAAKFMADPALFWRLCDANDAMRPEALTETVGAKLRITMPQGVTGSAL